METFSALLDICAGNSPVPGEFHAQRPVTRSFDVFFDMRLNKRLSKQSWGWWLETLSRPLWRHRNEFIDWVLFWVVAVWGRGRMVWCHSSAVANTKRKKVCLRKQGLSSLASMWGLEIFIHGDIFISHEPFGFAKKVSISIVHRNNVTIPCLFMATGEAPCTQTYHYFHTHCSNYANEICVNMYPSCTLWSIYIYTMHCHLREQMWSNVMCLCALSSIW